ncbi:LPP20 family lipoprotein [Paraferrimonas sp. SM1919]|uniref:LPP20 family lipoprotein n=1 Tax=Paraferrimonas sp. SM1919 TaxID=2662263 RepID=UPI0013D5591F|nr:LPP20 family lipoprotein [Paraferrimonas sp. SM1919]
MNKWILLLTSFLIIGGCSSSNDRYVQWQRVTPEQFPKLTAVGYASIDSQMGTTEQQKVLAAIKASKLEAYRELAEQIYGQSISSSSKVSDKILQSDSFTAQVNGVVSGAEIDKAYRLGDNYITELSLDFEKVWYLYQNKHPDRQVRDVVYF